MGLREFGEGRESVDIICTENRHSEKNNAVPASHSSSSHVCRLSKHPPHPVHLPPSHAVYALLHVVTFLSTSPQPGWKAPVINSYDLFIFVSPMSGIKALVQEVFIDPNWNKISGGKIICIFLISLLYQFSSFTSSSVAGSSGSRSERAKPSSRDKRDHQWEKTEQLWDRQT